MKSIKLIFAAAALASNVQVQAAPIFYDSEAAFLAAAAGYTLTLENFDSYSDGWTQNINNLASGLNISSAREMYVHRGSSCASGICLGVDTVGVESLSVVGPQTFSFDRGGISAFGISLGDLATVGETELTFTTDTGATQRYNFEKSPSRNQRYFGVIDTAAEFRSVTMTNSDGEDRFFMDNVRWGASNAVPEPGSLALAGLSLAMLTAVRRRKGY